MNAAADLAGVRRRIREDSARGSSREVPERVSAMREKGGSGMRKVMGLILIGGLVFALSLRSARAQSGEVYAITNARIVPITGPVIERGTIVIRGGKIAAVGRNVSIPAGARVINAQGMWVYPGFIDSGTTIGLTEIGQVPATVDVNELGDFNPQLRAITAVHPASEIIPVTRVNGITTVLTTPRGGILSGQAALINLDGWTWEEMLVKAPVGIYFNFPSIISGRFFDPETLQPRERSFQEARRQRDERLQRVKQLLEDARAYAKAKRAAEMGVPGGNAADGSGTLRPFLINPVLESLVPVVEGTVPLIVAANEERDIRAAVEFAEEQKVKIILSGGLEAPRVAQLLKEKNIPVLFGPVLSLPRREDDPYDSVFTAPKQLFDAGVKFAFLTNDAANVRNLPYHAAMAVAFGLPREEAVKALTIYPAEIFGVADRLGSIEVGKIANLVVWDGDPLEIRSQVRYLFINGKPVPLTSKHTQLYERYRNRP
jgi:imidazolonepropionase-like amidohydrolase